MKAVRLDDYYVNVLINGLYRQHEAFDIETNDFLNHLLLRLIDISDSMKPNRKKKLIFDPTEIKLIRFCLIEWRNDSLEAADDVAVEVIDELFLKLA